MVEEQPSDGDLAQRVRRVFDQVFRGELPFTRDLDRATVPRWTSLQHIEFLIALEKEFDIRFDGADATDMTTIPAVLSRVREKLA